MNVFTELAKYPVFTIDDVKKLTCNEKTAYISHHSALEYYGLANQVFYEMYVSLEILRKDT